ncbi:MAG TPA: carboxypeptidase-like regulatory domain-containing protein [Methylocella sp.]|nr:carboxypeptidase-like regulatory domain-containing protein [Methylocella sp.]
MNASASCSPGGSSSSSVCYGSGSTTGTTTTSSGSFKQDYSVSASADVGFLGTGGQIGVSFEYTRNSTNTQALSIQKSGSSTITATGPATDGIDHDNDIIYLWLNPVVGLSISGPAITWALENGSVADIQYLYVGWLKNPANIPTGVSQRLQQYGITSQDYPVILSSDPLANNTAPAEPRFISLPTTFPYEPPLVLNDPVPTDSYQLTNQTNQTSTTQTENDYKVGLSIKAGLNLIIVKTALNNDDSWTWTSMSQNSGTTGSTQTVSVTIAGPSFGYTGPTDVQGYYDTVYNSFAFAPVETTLVSLQGKVTKSTGTSVQGQEVIAMANGATYRTFTDVRGEYRFFAKLTGPVEIKVGAATQHLDRPDSSKSVDFRL